MWPPPVNVKILEPLSKDGPWKLSEENGEQYFLGHDEESTNKAVARLNGPWNERRIAALKFWRSHVFPTLCKAAEEGTLDALCQQKPGSRSFMEVALQTLDEIFFTGLLAPYCRVKWSSNECQLGRTYQLKLGELLIAVNLSEDGDVFELIGTLLHELCHAHEYLFTCHSGLLCDGICETSSSREKPEAHPQCFFHLSLHVQELATHLFGVEIRLGRVTAYLAMCNKHDIIPETLYIHEYFARHDEFKAVTKYREQRLKSYPEAGIEGMD